MNFPEGYLSGLTITRLQRHFPNLILGQNFKFTSLKTDDYNCVAWSTEIDDEWIQFPYDEQNNYDEASILTILLIKVLLKLTIQTMKKMF